MFTFLLQTFAVNMRHSLNFHNSRNQFFLANQNASQDLVFSCLLISRPLAELIAVDEANLVLHRVRQRPHKCAAPDI